MKQIKTKSLKQQLQQAAVLAHGSAKTEHDRKVNINRFFNYLKSNNIQIRDMSQIKGKYIKGYIEGRLKKGIGKRTLQNEMAAIRQSLRAVGRDKLADSESISNKALNLSGASRAGTKRAITDSEYQHIYHKALKTCPTIAAGMELGRALGLRGEEVVQSCQSLKTWKKALEQDKTKLNIVFGTKGGRPRETIIINRERALNAVNTALHFTEQQNGRLIDKPNLKQAMNHWHYHCRALGLKGEIAPHSLRYAFAQQATEHYIEQGYSQQEALALTSMDLGHGDGRGRYIKSTYILNA